MSEGGVKPNIIPDRSQLLYNLRAPSVKELNDLKEKVANCFEGAATATGCEVSVEWNPQRYLDVVSNNTLAELYQSNAKTLGVEFHGADFTASTDMGNVSHVVPSIHPMYSINTTAPNHSHAFTTAAATEVANQKTLVASKVMAMTAIDVLCDSDVIAKVRNDFELQK